MAISRKCCIICDAVHVAVTLGRWRAIDCTERTRSARHLWCRWRCWLHINADECVRTHQRAIRLHSGKLFWLRLRLRLRTKYSSSSCSSPALVPAPAPDPAPGMRIAEPYKFGTTLAPAPENYPGSGFGSEKNVAATPGPAPGKIYRLRRRRLPITVFEYLKINHF